MIFIWPKLKDFLGWSPYESDEELKESVGERFNNLAATEYADGIDKLVKRYESTPILEENLTKKLNLKFLSFIFVVVYLLLIKCGWQKI